MQPARILIPLAFIACACAEVRQPALTLGMVMAAAAPLTPELQKRARKATFEMVMPKPEKDTLAYEKPLPLDLLSYTERNDKYWSLGTAVALGSNLFVSAGHVMQSGKPSFRHPESENEGRLK